MVLQIKNIYYILFVVWKRGKILMKKLVNNVNGGGQKNSLNSYFQGQVILAYALHTNFCMEGIGFFCLKNI